MPRFCETHNHSNRKTAGAVIHKVRSQINIGGYAFEKCKSLKDVYYVGSILSWYSLEIDDENNYLLDANIHFDACINRKNHTYKTVTTNATYAKAGKVETKCTVCGKVTSTNPPFFAIYD